MSGAPPPPHSSYAATPNGHGFGDNATAGPSHLGRALSGASIDLTGDSDEDGLPSDDHHARIVEANSSVPSSGPPLGPPFLSPSKPSQHHPHYASPKSYAYPSGSTVNSDMNGWTPSVAGNGHLTTPGPSGAPSVFAASSSPYLFSTPAADGWTSNAHPSYGNGDMYNSLSANGFSNGFSNGIPTGFPPSGMSADSAIDMTNVRLPSPPAGNEKRAFCIGAIMSRVIMLWPSPPVSVGAQPPPGSREKYGVVEWRGAEMLKVKLKYRPAGYKPRSSELWPAATTEVIQVFTPGMSQYIGDLDIVTTEILKTHLARGLLRLEGFVQRLQPEAAQFEAKMSILLFTLYPNIRYIAQSLEANGVYLKDPIPPYNPARHTDHPDYLNAHGGHERAMYLENLAFRRNQPNFYSSAVKVSNVDTQKAQVDEVWKSIETGENLALSDPGPFIKTELFPHQRQAVTFLIQREQDEVSLRKAYRYMAKKLRRRGIREGSVASDGTGEVSKKVKTSTRSLFEPGDSKGGYRAWKNVVTGEEIKLKKHDVPRQSKGSILADDMGLGKTLSLISLIAVTRSEAKRWGKSKLLEVNDEEDAMKPKESDVNASAFQTRVFGMPTPGESKEVKGKGKKRKHDESKEPSMDRRGRLRSRSKGTLLLCPMSTITNWEDQIRDHWDGKIEVVGGAAGVSPPKDTTKPFKPKKRDDESSEDEDETLRVYIYHGVSRRSDVEFIKDFDIVITSYNTLALEYSRQAGSSGGDSTPTEMDGAEENGNTPMSKVKIQAEFRAADVVEALKSQGKPILGTCRGGNGKDSSVLQAVEWFRVVLDEAHYIKSATTLMSQAACELEADRRTCLTGTPIQNKVDDVAALFKFLRLESLDDKESFQKYILSPAKAGDPIGIARLQLVMRCCCLRRAKDTKTASGANILNLPPRIEEIAHIELRPDEREAYESVKGVAREKLRQIKDQEDKPTNRVTNMLHEVLRLRQICNHVDLAAAGAVEEDYDGTVMDYEVAKNGIEAHGLNQARALSVVCYLKDDGGASCVECNYDYGSHFPSLNLGGEVEEGEKLSKNKKLPHKPLLTRCLHLYCPLCFKKGIYDGWNKKMKSKATRPCLLCEAPLRLPTDVFEVLPPDEADENQSSNKPATRRKWVRAPGEALNLSAKMQWLHDDLLRLSKQNPNSQHYDPFALEPDITELDRNGLPLATKSVVFSQWTTMLDRIGDMLDEVKIRYARLDGTMTRDQRADAMDQLRSNKRVEILLVSIRAGGVGLNLTAATRCYLVDPYWNPAVEQQAIDRIHRMGQTRKVFAFHLVVENSIEEKIRKIQARKTNLAELSLKKMDRKDLNDEKAKELADLFA